MLTRNPPHAGQIDTLKHHKKDITEMRKGGECGIGFEEFQDLEVGDQIQAVVVRCMTGPMCLCGATCYRIDWRAGRQGSLRRAILCCPLSMYDLDDLAGHKDY
jgi:hypothetical protein